MESLKDLPRHQHCDNSCGWGVPGSQGDYPPGRRSLILLPSKLGRHHSLPSLHRIVLEPWRQNDRKAPWPGRLQQLHESLAWIPSLF